MGSPDQDFDLLLEAPDPTEAQLARDLLTAAGIPSYLHGRDASFADLGYAAHQMMTRPNLYVPKGARQIAQGVLDEAWEVGEPFSNGFAHP